MVKLSINELVALMKEGFAATPQRFADGVEVQLLRNAGSGQLLASTTSAETQMLARAVAKYRPLILEAAVEKLLRCEVVSVPAPICNAQSRIRKGVPVIAVFDGLLDVAVATIEMSYVVQELPAKLDSSFPQPEFPDVSTKSWAAVIFGALINRFVTHGEALPDFRTVVPTFSRSSEVEHGLLGTAWWVLLHELGHIELGHTPLAHGQSRLELCESLVVAQEISEYQQQEFEADAYVYGCLTDMGKKAFYTWTNHALGSMMMVETLLTKAKGTHPLSVNRLDRALRLSERVDEIAAELHSREHLLRHGKAHLGIQSGHRSIRSRGGKPIFEKWTREDLLTALRGLSNLFLEAGLNLEPFMNSVSGGWRSLFNE